MEKLYIKNLSIEVTRRCNMVCAHCMRGDTENLDIIHQDIRNILKHVQHVHCFNITGGEPSLNIKAIKYILKLLNRYQIHVYEFYIVTNGSLSSLSKQFIEICSELYEYQENKDFEVYSHMLEMSDDRFHDAGNHQKVISALSKYPFFGLRGQAENVFLYKEGRSSVGFENYIHSIYLSSENYVYGDVYLNAKGMILGNGNLSYQRKLKHELCNSGSFKSYLKSTKRKKQ